MKEDLRRLILCGVSVSHGKGFYASPRTLAQDGAAPPDSKDDKVLELRTAVAPTWNEIGQLASVIVPRTALNFFLQKEIEKSAPKKSQDSPVAPEPRKGM